MSLSYFQYFQKGCRNISVEMQNISSEICPLKLSPFSCRLRVTQLLYSVHSNGSMFSPELDEAPDPQNMTRVVESAVDSVSMLRSPDVIRRDYVFFVTVVGLVHSRLDLTNALVSAWQTAYSMLRNARSFFPTLLSLAVGG